MTQITNKEPLQPLEVVAKLNEIASQIDPESALDGLTKMTIAFGMLLDAYACPNADNPQGMAGGDELRFRLHFCKILAVPTSGRIATVLKERGSSNEKTN